MRHYHFKYPKLLLLGISIVLAIILFKEEYAIKVSTFLESAGYLGIFIAGFLFSYGFTTAPAATIFLILGNTHPLISTALIAGLGSLVGNLIFLSILRLSLADELDKLAHEKSVKSTVKSIETALPHKLKHYLAAIIAGIILASPLPDEVAVSFYAASHHTSLKVFSVLSYIFHTIGIFILLAIGHAI